MSENLENKTGNVGGVTPNGKVGSVDTTKKAGMSFPAGKVNKAEVKTTVETKKEEPKKEETKKEITPEDQAKIDAKLKADTEKKAKADAEKQAKDEAKKAKDALKENAVARTIIWDGKEETYDPTKKHTFKWLGRNNTENQRQIAGAFPNAEKEVKVDSISYKGYEITLSKYGSNSVTNIKKDGVVMLDNIALSSAIDYLQEKLNPGEARDTKWSEIDHVLKLKRGLVSRFAKLDANDNPIKEEKVDKNAEKKAEAEKAKAEKKALAEQAKADKKIADDKAKADKKAEADKAKADDLTAKTETAE